MSHELAEFNRRSFYSSRPSLSDVVKIKSSSYLREGTNRSLLLMILRSRHTHCLEAYQGAPSEGQLSPLRLTKKTKRCTLDKLVVDKQAFFFTWMLYRLNFVWTLSHLKEEKIVRLRLLYMQQGNTTIRDYV